jgi:dTMP kinase
MLPAALRWPAGGVLNIRAFRRLWLGLGMSSLGDWLGLLALTAMASALAPDSYAKQNFAIAGVLFLRVLPAAVLGPFAGYIADRLDRRRTLVAGDVARGVVFATIPIVNTLTWVYVATVVIESITLVWLPAKDATVPNLVPRQRLEAANQLSIATTYGSALPAAGIFIVLSLGTKGVHSSLGWLDDPVALALWFNAASFLVSGWIIATLGEIPAGPALAGDDRQSMWRVIADGWSYAVGTPVIRGLVLGITGAFAAGGVVVGLARVYVSDLGGGDPGYGVLFAAVFGGLALGMWRGPRLLPGVSRRRLFGLALVSCGVVLLGIGAIANLVVVAGLAVVLGFFAGAAWITGYTLLGLEVEDALRGRTFAFVQTLIRLALALVLALAPLIAGVLGVHRWRINDAAVVQYNGASLTILASAVAMILVGRVAYHAMNDKPGISVRSELRHSLTRSHDVYADTGVFVAFEGGEGVGKSTQARLLRDTLVAQGYDVVLTHEPGDSPVGQRLRDILLDPRTGSLDVRAEALLYAADKAEHVQKVVLPALRRGAVVVTDRYVDSFLAYQGAGRALAPRELERLARWATEALSPHLTVLLDLAPASAASRLGSPDRLEAEPLAFHERVRAAFLRIAHEHPETYLVEAADAPAKDIAARVLERVGQSLAQAQRTTRADA